MGNFESTENYGHFDISKLKVDEAYLTINSTSNRLYDLSILSSDCVQCAPYQMASFVGNLTVKIDTKHSKTFYLHENSTSIVCSATPSIGEFGIYEWRVEENCVWRTVKQHDNIYWALLFALVFYLLIFAICFVANFVYVKFNGETGKPGIETKRLRSIDVFRGLCIILMIFVNYGGGYYVFFGHSTWDGLLVADFVFPSFLWIMGVCIPISIRSVLRSTTSLKISFFRIAKRSVYLLVLGLMLTAGPDVTTLRYFGVLQRFSFTYLTVATVCLCFSSWFEKDFKESKWRDLIRLLPHWIVMAAIFLIHAVVTFCLPVPGCPTGYLGPGGDHLNGSYRNCTGGSTGYVDRLLLGSKHLFQGSTIGEVYRTNVPFEPEGIMGTFTSCIQVFFGVQAGSILLTFPGAKPRIFRWIIWAVVSGGIGLLLSKGFATDGWIPVNKNLWSISYVLVTSSVSFLVLAAFYYLVDVRKWWSGSPFYFPGMNSILLYCGHMIAFTAFPLVWQLPEANTHAICLLMHLWTTTAWLLVSVWLYRIKFFLAL